MSGLGGSALILGFLLGLRHAFDADHLVAVSNLVAVERHLGRSTAIALTWATGHTLALSVVSGLVAGLHWSIGERLAAGFELLVAVLIVLLGGRLLLSAWRGGRLHSHRHAHGPRIHSHLHLHAPHDHDPPGAAGGTERSSLLLPLLVGVAHGLAGSGALTVLLASALHGPGQTLTFLLLFGIGSAAGMIGTSGLVAVSARWSARRLRRGWEPIQTALALASIGFGLWLATSLLIAPGV